MLVDEVCQRVVTIAMQSASARHPRTSYPHSGRERPLLSPTFARNRRCWHDSSSLSAIIQREPCYHRTLSASQKFELRGNRERTGAFSSYSPRGPAKLRDGVLRGWIRGSGFLTSEPVRQGGLPQQVSPSILRWTVPAGSLSWPHRPTAAASPPRGSGATFQTSSLRHQ
jgi:hypothetical protein